MCTTSIPGKVRWGLWCWGGGGHSLWALRWALTSSTSPIEPTWPGLNQKRGRGRDGPAHTTEMWPFSLPFGEREGGGQHSQKPPNIRDEGKNWPQSAEIRTKHRRGVGAGGSLAVSEPPPHAFAQPKDSGERRTKQGHGEGGGAAAVSMASLHWPTALRMGMLPFSTRFPLETDGPGSVAWQWHCEEPPTSSTQWGWHCHTPDAAL